MRKVVIAAAVGTVAAAGVAIVAAPQLRGYVWPEVKAADTPAAPAQQPGIPVTAGTVAAADVPVFLTGIGTVQAYNMNTIKTRVDGQIVKVSFDEGQEVKAGDPLIQIDPRPFKAALEVVQATKAKDEAQLVSAQADLDRYSQ